MVDHVSHHTVPPHHHCLPGHFPGQPVVPAVVLLDFAARALDQALGRPVRVAAIPAAKFLRPCPPGQPFAVTLQVDEARRSVRFSIAADGGELANGRFEYVDAA